MNKLQYVALLFGVVIPVAFLSGCGGSSSDSGVSFSGLLTQGATEDQTLRHSENENIENVEICALGQCSTTDSAGLWGFVADNSFTGGTILFTIKGHDIDDLISVTIPTGANEVDIHFENRSENKIELHHLIVDGVSVSEVGGHNEG